VADQGVAVGPDWLSYHLATLDRKPRPLLRAACDLLGAGAGRTAVDLGCGAGADVLALLADGWSVVAVDREQAGLDLLRGRVTADDAGQVRIVRASFTEVALPHAHLVHAGYSVPFCRPEDFSDVWTGIRSKAGLVRTVSWPTRSASSMRWLLARTLSWSSSRLGQAGVGRVGS
jgi:SAM-dependent methyltransferase